MAGPTGTLLGFDWDLHRTVLWLYHLSPPPPTPETNLWLLVAMVAREQVDNDGGPQRGNESAPEVGGFGLLPQRHLQQWQQQSISNSFLRVFIFKPDLGFDSLGIY